jgi:hypothetical protein
MVQLCYDQGKRTLGYIEPGTRQPRGNCRLAATR